MGAVDLKTYGALKSFVKKGYKDVYSTTETKTNKVWIDGKPIYRKVFNTGISFGTSNQWENTGAVFSNLSTLISVFALRNNITVVYQFSYAMNGNDLTAITSVPLGSPVDTIIVEYTKTT